MHALRTLPEDALELRARAHAQLALLPPHSLEREQTQRLSAEAVRLAEQAGGAGLLEALHSRLFGLCGPATIEESLRVADAVLGHDPAPMNRWAADAHQARYFAFMQLGDASRAARELAAYRGLATRSGLRFVRWQCDRLQAQQLLHAGHLDEAERRFDELFTEAQHMQLTLATFHISVQRTLLSRERMGRRPAERCTDEPIEPPNEASPGMRVQHVLVSLERGAIDAAAREFRKLAEHEFASVAGSVFGTGLLAQLARAAVALNDRSAMFVLRELLAPHAHLVGIASTAFSHGCFARYLGLLEDGLGNQTEARQYFEQAIEVNARAGHQLELQRASLGLAELLAVSDSASERTQALEIARRIGSEAQGMGALTNAVRAHELAKGLEEARRPDLPATATRTAR